MGLDAQGHLTIVDIYGFVAYFASYHSGCLWYLLRVESTVIVLWWVCSVDTTWCSAAETGESFGESRWLFLHVLLIHHVVILNVVSGGFISFTVT